MKAIRNISRLLVLLLVFVFIIGAGRYARHYVPMRTRQIGAKVSSTFDTIANHGRNLWRQKIIEVEELFNGIGH